MGLKLNKIKSFCKFLESLIVTWTVARYHGVRKLILNYQISRTKRTSKHFFTHNLNFIILSYFTKCQKEYRNHSWRKHVFYIQGKTHDFVRITLTECASYSTLEKKYLWGIINFFLHTRVHCKNFLARGILLCINNNKN